MTDELMKRVNVCASGCAEQNHFGQEHIEWVAERFTEAREVTERVDAHLAAAKELATIVDPDAFEDHPIERRREGAALQWTARRFIATEHADRILRSDWLADRLAVARAEALTEAAERIERACLCANRSPDVDPPCQRCARAAAVARDGEEGL